MCSKQSCMNPTDTPLWMDVNHMPQNVPAGFEDRRTQAETFPPMKNEMQNMGTHLPWRAASYKDPKTDKTVARAYACPDDSHWLHQIDFMHGIQTRWGK